MDAAGGTESDHIIRGDLTEAVGLEQLRQRRKWEWTQRRSDDQRNIWGGGWGNCPFSD